MNVTSLLQALQCVHTAPRGPTVCLGKHCSPAPLDITVWGAVWRAFCPALPEPTALNWASARWSSASFVQQVTVMVYTCLVLNVEIRARALTVCLYFVCVCLCLCAYKCVSGCGCVIYHIFCLSVFVLLFGQPVSCLSVCLVSLRVSLSLVAGLSMCLIALVPQVRLVCPLVAHLSVCLSACLSAFLCQH